MNKLKEVLKREGLKVKGLKYIGKVIVFDTDKGKLVYKEGSNNYPIYDYLKTRGFEYFPKCYGSKNAKYDLQEYIPCKEIPSEQKLIDLIHLSGILHRKTSFKKEIDMDEIKGIYEDISNEVDYLRKYYEDLNNYIDTVVFMSPSEYLLVSNIDVIYYLLTFVKVEIGNWYKEILEKKVIRNSLIHNNLSLDHLLVGEGSYLISWNKAKLDIPVLDLVKVYQDNFYDLDLEDLIREYTKEIELSKREYLFFLIKLSIPKRIEFTKNTYEDCYKINNYLVYLHKIAFVVQKYAENHEKV